VTLYSVMSAWPSSHPRGFVGSSASQVSWGGSDEGLRRLLEAWLRPDSLASGNVESNGRGEGREARERERRKSQTLLMIAKAIYSSSGPAYRCNNTMVADLPARWRCRVDWMFRTTRWDHPAHQILYRSRCPARPHSGAEGMDASSLSFSPKSARAGRVSSARSNG
jgi:hypothetical protein